MSVFSADGNVVLPMTPQRAYELVGSVQLRLTREVDWFVELVTQLIAAASREPGLMPRTSHVQFMDQWVVDKVVEEMDDRPSVPVSAGQVKDPREIAADAAVEA